jgi:hypothetical protein
MSLPIEISVSHEYGGIGWVSDIWWRVSNDNERIVKIAIDSFLKKSGPREIKFTKQFDIMNSCFVATEIFGEQSKEVVILRYWRNEYLSKSFWGRSFISIYYWLGPHFAIAVRKSNLLKSFIRSALLKMCKKLSKHYLL